MNIKNNNKICGLADYWLLCEVTKTRLRAQLTEVAKLSGVLIRGFQGPRSFPLMFFYSNNFVSFFFFIQYLYSLEDGEDLLCDVLLETPQQSWERKKFAVANRVAKRKTEKKAAIKVARHTRFLKRIGVLIRRTRTWIRKRRKRKRLRLVRKLRCYKNAKVLVGLKRNRRKPIKLTQRHLRRKVIVNPVGFRRKADYLTQLSLHKIKPTLGRLVYQSLLVAERQDLQFMSVVDDADLKESLVETFVSHRSKTLSNILFFKARYNYYYNFEDFCSFETNVFLHHKQQDFYSVNVLKSVLAQKSMITLQIGFLLTLLVEKAVFLNKLILNYVNYTPERS